MGNTNQPEQSLKDTLLGTSPFGGDRASKYVRDAFDEEAIARLNSLGNVVPSKEEEADVRSYVMAYLNSERGEAPSVPEIEFTDDIGESEAFTRLVDMIVDSRLESKDVSFPFRRFSTFNPRSLNHKFKILAIHKDMLKAGEAIRRMQPLFELQEIFSEPGNTESDIVARLLQLGHVSYSSDSKQMGKDVITAVASVLRKSYSSSEDKGRDEWTVKIAKELESIASRDVIECKVASGSIQPAAVGPYPQTSYLHVDPSCMRVVSSSAHIIHDETSFITDRFGTYINKPSARRTKPIDTVVIHGTGGPSDDPKTYFLTGERDSEWKKGNALYHYHINRKGYIRMMVNPLLHVVYHSSSGMQDLTSIGIELENPNNAVFDYTDAQYQSLFHLIFVEIMKNQKNRIRRIAGHDAMGVLYSSESYGPKPCPGPKFKWDSLISEAAKHKISAVLDSVDGATGSAAGSVRASFNLVSADKELLARLRDMLGVIVPPFTSSSSDAVSKGDGQNIRKWLSSTSRTAYARMINGFYNYFSNDLSSRIEDVQITHIPGTSVSIPLEGTEAPVCQSTGGRRVQTVVRFKGLDAVELAKLAVLFRVTGAEDQLLSMLSLSRSSFRAGSGRARIRYLLKVTDIENTEQVLKTIIGSGAQVQFDEPIRIENDLLNALGLDTFIPTDISIETNPELSGKGHGVFDVTITFQYINLSVRGIESLKKKKQAGSSPVLPLACRLDLEYPDGTGMSPRGVASEMDQRLVMANQFSHVSFSTGLLEVMGVYVLSKFYRMKTAAEESEDRVLRFLPLAASTSVDQVVSNLDRWNSVINSNIAGMAGLLGATLSSDIRSVVNKVEARFSTIAKNGRFGIIGKTVMGIGSLVPLVSVLGMDTKKDMGEVRYQAINIADIMPTLVFDMLLEFNQWMLTNTVDENIERMGREASLLVEDGSEFVLPNGTTGLRISVKVEIPSEYTDTATSLVITDPVLYFSSAVINNQSSGYITGNIETGYKKLLARIRPLNEQTQEDLMRQFVSLPATRIIQSVINALQVRGSLFGSTQYVSPCAKDGDIIRTAYELQSDPSAVGHVREILATLISTSGTDMVASGFLVSCGSGKHSAMANIVKRYVERSNTNNLMTEYIGEKLLGICDDLSGSSSLLSETFGIQSRTSRSNLDVEPLMCGMYADNSFTSPALRSSLSRAMDIVLFVMKMKALSSISGESDPYFPVTPYMVIETTNGSSAHVDAFKVLVGQLLETAFMIASAILDDILVALLLTKAGGPVGALLGVLYSIIMPALQLAYMFYTVIMTAVRQGVQATVIRMPRLFTYSRWLSGRLRDGIDSSTLLEMAERTNIWPLSILSNNTDASDGEMSSYLDYPIVTLSGKAMMPDHYVYKISAISSAYERIRESMHSMLDYTSDTHTGDNDLDYASLMKELEERVTAINGKQKAEFAYDIESVLEYYVNRAYSQGARVVADLCATIPKALDAAVIYMSGGTPTFSLLGLSGVVTIAGKTEKVDSKQRRPLFTVKFTVTDGSVDKKVTGVTLEVANETIQDMTASSRPEDQRFMNTVVNSSTKFEMFAMKATDAGYGDMFTTIGPIFDALTQYVRIIVAMKETIGSTLKNIPDTIGYLMLLKNIVGSSIRSVGKPGMSLVRSQVNEMTDALIRRSGAFQSGYVYPTIKLYFIDEDNESWYLFDDLYSYASVVDVMVHSDEDSPQDVAVIRVTNIFGNLNNVMADRVNMEANFLMAPDENTPIHGLMLRTGCRIKLQAGATPFLDENDTIFTGEISSINFDEVVTIEAIGHGSSLFEEISPNKVKTYPESGDSTLKYLFQLAMNGALGMTAIKKVFGMDGMSAEDLNYMPLITKIRDIIGYVLTDITSSSTKLDDYSILPEFETEITGDISLSVSDLSEKIKHVFSKRVRDNFVSLLGVNTEVKFNRQLLENVAISGDVDGAGRLFDVMTILDMDSWVSYNETGWDVLQELNLMLPNNQLLVRPYDTRSTLVWGPCDGYYRFKRSTDVNSIVSVMVVRKLKHIVGNGNIRPLTFLEDLEAYVKDDSASARKVMALLALIVSTAQRMEDALITAGGTIVSDETMSKRRRQYITLEEDDTPIRKVYSWMGFTANKPLHEQIASFRKYVKDALDYISSKKKEVSATKDSLTDDTLAKIRAIPVSPRGGFTMEMYSVKNATESVLQRRAIIFAVCLEEWLKHGLDMAYSCSTSHRRISQIHPKSSGRDIVKNDIMLQAPYNALNISFPSSTENDPESIVSPSGKKDMYVKAHYRIKPWAERAYSSYFKNANVLSKARASVISMASGNILKNLMGQVYGGSITLLGDPKIHAGDRIYIWDENRDMWGIVGVKARTFMFSPIEGCLTVVEPRMVARTEYGIGVNASDQFLYLAETVMGLYFAWQGLKALKHSGANILDMVKAREIIKGEYGTYSRLQRLAERNKIVSGAMGRGFGMYEWVAGRKVGGKVLEVLNIRPPKKEGEILLDPRVRDPLVNVSRKLHDSIIDTESRIDKDLNQDVISKLVLDEVARKVNYVSDRSKTNRKLQKYMDESTVTITDNGKVLDIVRKYYKKHLSRMGQDHQKRGAIHKQRDDMLLLLAAEDSVKVFTDAASEMIYAGLIRVNHKGAPVDISTASVEIGRALGRALNSGLGEKEVPLLLDSYRAERGLGQVVDELISGLKSAGKPDDHMSAITAIASDVSSDAYGLGSKMKNHILKVGGIIFKYYLQRFSAYGILSATRGLQEFALISKYTANNLIVAPLFFRGEPLIAGLEGMIKKDGEEVGWYDATIGSRFQGLKESLYHGFTDPYAEFKFVLNRSMLRNSRLTGGPEKE